MATLVDQLTKIINGNAFPYSRKIFEDFPDKLCSIWAVYILILFSSIITVRSYFFNPFACFVDQNPTGLNFLTFIESYCWTHGTYSIGPDEKFPQEEKDWKLINNRIKYYQWIPFILALQTIGFYFPRLLWNNYLLQVFGVDIEYHFEKEMSKAIFSEEDISKLSKIIKNSLHEFHKYPKIRKPTRLLLLFFLQSKLLRGYYAIKSLFFINCVLQVVFIHKILGLSYTISSFHQVVEYYVYNNTDTNWNVYFPKVTYCFVNSIVSTGKPLVFVAQCVLTVNMINEKIYLFLWVWTLIVGLLVFISTLWWFKRLLLEYYNRNHIKSLIMIWKISATGEMVDEFLNHYLHGDGLFILLMLIKIQNKTLAQLVFRNLWNSYMKAYQSGRFLPRCNGNLMEKLNENLDFV